ncbi:MAG: thioesterase [Chloroflexi bacterium]|nr:thioesterase [Chloroflexota bacterium]
MINILKNLTIPQLKQLPRVYEAAITADYLDRMGHMNVRYYLHIFDDATWDLFAKFGMDRDYYTNSGNGSFALQQFIVYAAEVHAGETVGIRSRIIGRSEKRIHFMHFMINESTNRLAASMEILGSHADLTLRRTSPYPPEIASRLDMVIAEYNQLSWDAPVCGAINL